ncbi:MAG: hypothetical protein IKN91_07240 [Paludibacteraceae bacterium]|nr:hypothetical protein [Paludibacteraceae bacterium]
MERFDKYWIGILVGALSPILFMWAYIERYELWYYLQTMQFYDHSILSKLLLCSVFPDMGLIFVFYLTNTWNLSKGILIGMMPFMIASLLVSM